MSQDQPSLPDILRVVRDFIEQIKEDVPDKDRYHAMCCSYLLSVAEREISDDARLADKKNDVLCTFLGRPMVPLAATRALAAGLREGRFDEQWDKVTELVLHHVIDKVMVSKPEHLNAIHREERR